MQSRLGLASAATQLLLPLKAEHQADGGARLRSQLAEVTPSLLLFLQRLQVRGVVGAEGLGGAGAARRVGSALGIDVGGSSSASVACRGHRRAFAGRQES